MTVLTPALRTLNLLAIQKPAVTARLIRQVAGMETVVLLDLEDSLWDVADPERTAQLKSGARKDLLELAKNSPDLFRQFKIGMRINKYSTSEFSADLAVLSEIAEKLPLSVIVPTKVESVKELDQCCKEIARSNLRCEGIVPIVETLAGMENLEEIASAAAALGIPAVVYGHYDYSLSAGHWPFLEFDETEYWRIAGSFIEHVEQFGLGYVQAPLFNMHDDRMFLGMLGEMNRRCSNPFGVLTFGPQQTRLCADVVAGRIQPEMMALRGSKAVTATDRIQLAKELRQAYESHRKEDKSFAIDPRTGRFISPHHYAAALAVMSEENA